jgi:quinol monooxygenase YgiN
MRIRVVALSLSLLAVVAAVHAQAPATGAAPRPGAAPRFPSTATAFVVQFKVKAGQDAAFEKVFREMELRVATNEPGNLSYDLYRTGQSHVYVIVERYKDPAAIRAHGKDAGNLMAELRPLMDGPPTAQALTLVSSK